MDPALQVRDDTPTYIFNPLDKDLVISEHDENNAPVIYTVPSMELVPYPKWLADILRKHLIDAMINERNPKFPTPEIRAEYAKETNPDNL